jgi:prepilin-type N-terminal cleavage/methylation domain-containing protein
MASSQACREMARGFSLLELLIAMVITMIVGLGVFQLFIQNESVFRDQDLVLEMQQSTRAVASMIADELRIAGQGVPAYAASLDATTQEAAQTFLNGSDSTNLVFRAGVRNGTAIVEETLPLNLSVGTAATLDVDDAGEVSAIVGSNTDRFLYLWGPSGESWTWVRAQIDAINTGTDTITLTPQQTASAGGVFDGTPNLSVEEAIGYRINGTDIQRGTSGDFTSLTAPVMTYSTLGSNFTALTFTYYDASDSVVAPTTLSARSSVVRVDFRLVARTAEELPSTGAFDTYAIEMTVFPRNVAIY